MKWGHVICTHTVVNTVTVQPQVVTQPLGGSGISVGLYGPAIQGDSGGIYNTLGNDSMCDSKQKSSYEHGSNFERLWSYDRLKLRIEGNDY